MTYLKRFFKYVIYSILATYGTYSKTHYSYYFEDCGIANWFLGDKIQKNIDWQLLYWTYLELRAQVSYRKEFGIAEMN